MADLRAGLLGVGMMGRHHARVLRELDGVELVAIADPGGDPHGVAGDLEILPDIDALIDTGIDLAVVAVPTRFHEDAALKLAAAGVHTLVEKPIAHTVDAGRRMVDAFAAAGLVGAVGHIERFNPAVQELRRRIEAGSSAPCIRWSHAGRAPSRRGSRTSGWRRTSPPMTSTSRPGSCRATTSGCSRRPPSRAAASTRT